MSVTFNANVLAAMIGRDAARRTTNEIQKTSERLSTGLQINRAADDASGIAIFTRISAQIRGFNQSKININDKISLSEIALGSLKEVTNMLQRMRELTVQAGNKTNTIDDLIAINKEFNQLRDHVSHIASQTKFNGISLLDGTFSDNDFHVSSEPEDRVSLDNQPDVNPYALGIREILGETLEVSGEEKLIPGEEVAVPAPVPEGWVKFGNSIYKMSETETSWSAAEAQAIAEGGHLVAINSEEENNFIISEFLSQKAPIHIGLTDAAEEGVWKWTNGDPITYSDWTTIPPQPGNETGNEDGAAIGYIEEYENNTFDKGSEGSNTIEGWKIKKKQIILGIDTIEGQKTPTDTTMQHKDRDGKLITVSDQYTPPWGEVSFTTKLSSNRNDDSGYSVQLNSYIRNTENGYDVVRGPYIYSDNAVALQANDTVSFEWKAEGGDDAYDVFGYIVDENDEENYQIILDETGDRVKYENINGQRVPTSGFTEWATKGIEVKKDGQYRFVFVSGTYDATGGHVAGAQLYIDDVIVNRAQGSSGTWNDIPTASLATGIVEKDAPVMPSDTIVPLPATGLIEKETPYDQTTLPDTLITLPHTHVTLPATRSGISLADIMLTPSSNIGVSLGVIDQSVKDVSGMASSFGAYQNKLKSMTQSLTVMSESTSKAESNIRDADMAAETANLAKATIIQKAGTALLAQANLQSEKILQLLH